MSIRQFSENLRQTLWLSYLLSRLCRTENCAGAVEGGTRTDFLEEVAASGDPFDVEEVPLRAASIRLCRAWNGEAVTAKALYRGLRLCLSTAMTARYRSKDTYEILSMNVLLLTFSVDSRRGNVLAGKTSAGG